MMDATFDVRDGRGVITFTGTKLAHVTTELPSKPRWSEFSIYVTSFGEWVLQGVGRTRMPGEEDRYWSIITDNPIDIVDAVARDASKPAKKLLADSLLFLRAGASSVAVAG